MSIQRYAIFQHVRTGMRELYDESVEKEKTETFRRVSVWFVKEAAATARVERAETCLRALDSYFEFSSIPNGAEGFVVTGDAAGLTEAFAEAASILSASPPARARAEEALRNIRCVARTPEEADSPEAAFELIERLAQGALDDHSADASTIVGERERREDKK